MTMTQSHTGFRLGLGPAMVAIALIALALAPLAAFARSPSAERLVSAAIFEVFVMPLAIMIALACIPMPEGRRDRIIARFWMVWGMMYLILLFSPIVFALILFFYDFQKYLSYR